MKTNENYAKMRTFYCFFLAKYIAKHSDKNMNRPITEKCKNSGNVSSVVLLIAAYRQLDLYQLHRKHLAFQWVTHTPLNKTISN